MNFFYYILFFIIIFFDSPAKFAFYMSLIWTISYLKAKKLHKIWRLNSSLLTINKGGKFPNKLW